MAPGALRARLTRGSDRPMSPDPTANGTLSTPESPAEAYRPPLVVYVVWHPKSVEGAALAGRIYGHLMRDPRQPSARGIGVPVYFRTSADPSEPPADIDFDRAHHTAVVVLVDDTMVAGWDKGWGRYVEGLWRRAP